MTERKLRLGAAGLGRAFVLMRSAFAHHPRIDLIAAADPREEARSRFAAEFSARTYDSVEALCADADVEAVYIATPHQFHAQDVITAARNGKHVLVEKPMALSLQECQAMIAATRDANVRLVVGHSHSFDAPIARTRSMIAGGTFGRLRMITAVYFTDFLYRPRRPEELGASTGGGVLLNQAPHHVDIMRMLGGGLVKSVRALTGAWDAQRPVEGAYSALFTFEDGAFATLTYSGYAHFDGDELSEWIAEGGYPKDPAAYGSARASLRGKTRAEELTLKNALNYGGSQTLAVSRGPRVHQHFGLVVASCDSADLRPGPKGVTVYGDESRSFEPVAVPDIPRSEVIDEFCAAIFGGKPPKHSGAWGLATMEVCFAMQQSAREGREIELQLQVAVND
ncbi:MAG: Gfo/Idh/MocA family oxidoreductase [Hyphomicrobiaceae bacterium]